MPEPRVLLRFTVVGLAAYGVTLLGDYSLKLTVFREKPVTALAIATVVSTAFRWFGYRRWVFPSAPPVGVAEGDEAELFVERPPGPRGGQRDGQVVEVP
jgi:hypothetical protein